MFNKEKSKREVILYKLLPYCSDSDFQTAIENQKVDDTTFSYQTRFSYWIAMFESTFGNIVSFWESTKAPESERIISINNLIISLINSNTNGKETSS